MKLSINWVKEFVSIPPEVTDSELISTITLSTCEVEGHEFFGENLKDIFTAEVLEINPHPEADKLSLVIIDKGGATEQVVCGASNFKIGDKVAFAGLGVKISEDFTIKKAKIRGVESCGMLCAGDELGFSDDHDGLMILPQKTKVGMALSELYPDHIDLVLEIDNKSITHRPDLWGHYGFAREIAAIYHQTLQAYSPEVVATAKGPCPVSIEVKDNHLTPRYSALALDKIQIGPSPAWIQHRLFRVGLRAINNAVDVTNFVMLELGEPMHAFDRAKIAGDKLVIRKAKKGEKLMTLYDKEAEFTEENLIITDANQPTVVAGVIGGLNSGVTESTDKILLEAANWEPVSVRKTSVQIGLRTDSSQRFEKSLDPELTLPAIYKAVELLKLTSPNLTVKGKLFDHYSDPKSAPAIETSVGFINKRLGTNLKTKLISDILTSLEFQVMESDGQLKVTPPSFRATKDIKIPEDLVEEIGRIYGFTNIKPVAPHFATEKPIINPKIAFERTIQTNLVDQGLFEIYCYPLTDENKEKQFGFVPKGVMKLLNPVSEHHQQMRTSMLPHFVDRLYNCQKEDLDFGLFEVGRVYNKIEGAVVECNRLVIGQSIPKSKKVGQAFYQLKSTLISLFNSLMIDGIELKAKEKAKLGHHQHRHIQAEFSKDGIPFADLYQFSPATFEKHSLKGEVAIAKINLDELFSLKKSDYRYHEPFKYPTVHFELSIVVPKRVTFGQIKDLLKEASTKIQRVDFVSLFELETKEKSLSVMIEFRDHTKTLDSEEIKSLQDKMIATVTGAGFHLR